MDEALLDERELREQWQEMHVKNVTQWQSMHTEVHCQEKLARDKAESTVNNRLDGMNELRSQINSERGSYATRDYVDTVNSSTDGRLKALERKDSNTDGRFWVLGALVVIINLIMFFLGKR